MAKSGRRTRVSNCPPRSGLLAFSTGNDPDEPRTARHLKNCATCRQAVSRARALLRTAGQLASLEAGAKMEAFLTAQTVEVAPATAQRVFEHAEQIGRSFLAGDSLAASFKRLLVEQIGDVTVVHLNDSGLVQQDAEMRNELLDHLRRTGSRKVIVNMQQVRHMTSETISALLIARNQIAARKGEMRVCDVPSGIREVLALLRLDSGVFHFRDSTEEALRDLTQEKQD